MKNINNEFLIIASNGTLVNARAYSTEETLRKYMKLFDGSFGGISVNKKVDDIISEAKTKGYSDFKSHNQYIYRLCYWTYIEGYTDYGVK